MTNLSFCVKYPFTQAAKEVIQKSEITITDTIIERAMERITAALTEGKLSKSIPLHDSERLEEIAANATARMILGQTKSRYLINKYAVAESKRASHYLEDEDEETIKQVALDFKIETKKEGDKLIIPVYTYLKYAPRSIDYKLMNRELVGGQVKIKPREKIRIIEEAVRKHMEKIPLVKTPPQAIVTAAEKLNEMLPKLQPQEQTIPFNEADLPPCIGRLIESIKKHENLGHQARWYLAVYLLGSKMNFEEIVTLYSNLPDYNEKITRYQLEHAQKKGYVVPACATINTWGLCCAECKIGSPLNWKTLRKQEKESLMKTGRR